MCKFKYIHLIIAVLTRRKMIDIGLLCGSDYTDGIQGVGPVTAMEILGEFQGLELTPLQSFRCDWMK